MRLYDYELSGNCYKIRLLLAMLGLHCERVRVDSSRGETQTEAFRQLNPRGQIPVLLDGDLRLWDSQAILVYLARRYGDPERACGPWLPADPFGEAEVMQWLAVAENELLFGLARARSALRFRRPFDLAQCQAEGKTGLAALEDRLAGREWLVGDCATIADIACYPYVYLAPESGVSLEPYPNIRAWLARFAQLPDYQVMVDPAAERAAELARTEAANERD
ncbi:glutathione S-transferase family protein [uncultured Thiodictyon sp.]|uniref:glutathione S-transferase family protein n=1 Tax=uncultured Thiodictyon sp. TaxID=1846217 RepID=UPI0025FC3737|nr:glutathione S-transferase family protein [uncultured Thiodictyon sp.]